MSTADYVLACSGLGGTFTWGFAMGTWASGNTVGSLVRKAGNAALRRAPVAAALAEPEGEKYGHPKPPVDYLYKSLPSPPQGCAWEIEVVPSELIRKHKVPKGVGYKRTEEKVPTLDLELRLLDLVSVAEQGTGTVIAKMSKNLFWETWYDYAEIGEDGGGTWGREYRTCYDENHTFRNQFIGPFTTWARQQIDHRKATNIDTTNPGEYRMKT